MFPFLQSRNMLRQSDAALSIRDMITDKKLQQLKPIRSK